MFYWIFQFWSRLETGGWITWQELHWNLKSFPPGLQFIQCELMEVILFLLEKRSDPREAKLLKIRTNGIIYACITGIHPEMLSFAAKKILAPRPLLSFWQSVNKDSTISSCQWCHLGLCPRSLYLQARSNHWAAAEGVKAPQTCSESVARLCCCFGCSGKTECILLVGPFDASKINRG